MKLRHIISTPFIYGMVFPAVIFHICLEIYHQVCFRLYKIPLVKSKEYFIYNRQLIKKLKLFDKFNCFYCSYVNNLIRYAAEIGGRTERYWCPLKYYKQISNPHSQYNKFLTEDSEQHLQIKWENLRDFSDLD
jgi:hypothetical protein